MIKKYEFFNPLTEKIELREYAVGPMGPMGPQGPKGDQGERGEKGDKGDQGPIGKTGLQGIVGPQGFPGKDGLNGLNGKNGIDGKDGTVIHATIKEPDNSIGREGDWAINAFTQLFYREKNKWKFIQDLTGRKGQATIPDPQVSAISASAIDWSLLKNSGGVYTKTLSANTTFTFSGAIAGQTIVVRLTNTASNYTVTWPTVRWSGGVAPTMTVGAKSDVYSFIYDGTNYYGSAVQDMS